MPWWQSRASKTFIYMAGKYDIGLMGNQWPSGAASGDHMGFPEASQMGPGALM